MQLQDLKSQLTLVFPVRIDCEERRENLRVVLRQLDGLGLSHACIGGRCGASPWR